MESAVRQKGACCRQSGHRAERALPVIDLSVVIPVFNEEPGLAALVDRLEGMRRSLPDLAVEVILVDDHSTDRSPELLARICAEHDRFRAIRLARNAGSHVAIIAGLDHARGRCAVFLAADLQDPPELVPQMLERWGQGYHVVWAVREDWEGRPWTDRALAGVFYGLLNRMAQIRIAPQGSDFVLMDRTVVEALRTSRSTAPFLMGEIARLGFRSTEVGYRKEARRFGRSKWTLGKKLRTCADAFVGTSYLPLRLMAYLGLLFLATGFGGLVVLGCLQGLGGSAGRGWLGLAGVVVFLAGLQMTMLGVLGEYLWRTLEAARRRPLYFVEWSPTDGPAPACSTG